MTDYLEPDEEKPQTTIHEDKKARVRHRLARDKYKQQIFSGEIQASGLFETDVDLIEMRRYFNPRFLRRYEIGLRLYLEGYWPESKQIFDEINRIKGCQDKPT